ncbi:MAG: hypothetical protein AAFO73_07460 [Pseudomonadota bacterium]
MIMASTDKNAPLGAETSQGADDDRVQKPAGDHGHALGERPPAALSKQKRKITAPLRDAIGKRVRFDESIGKVTVYPY